MDASAADSIPEYDELRLRVEVHDEATYDVVAFAPDGGTVTGRFERPLSDERARELHPQDAASAKRPELPVVADGEGEGARTRACSST